ncbi:hypothetical protein BD413DRAFT_587036 [Trametes elegans]|nr:hypothetical protein BD413DRAFT_587036 [Trametes elegans]
MHMPIAAVRIVDDPPDAVHQPPPPPRERTMPDFERPTVLTRSPPPATPEPPPSPPPSRLGTHTRSCTEVSEDPFRDPTTSKASTSAAGAGQPSSSAAGEHFSAVFSDSDDEEGEGEQRSALPMSSKGKEKETRGEAWWRKQLREWKLVLMLENSGSVARDHLASERTFLAYVRTSLTMASAGVGTSSKQSPYFWDWKLTQDAVVVEYTGLVQLFSLSASTANREDLERFARPLGAVMIGIGLYTLAVGASRFFLVQNALIRGVYPVARVSTTAMSFAVLAMVIAVFTVILVAT